MTEDQLKAIMPQAGSRVRVFAPLLADCFLEFDIYNLLRQAAFIAQVAHESGQFYFLQELADGSAYEGRLDLGNTQPGDGKLYKGRGLIQVTGRANYQACGNALKLDLIAHPQLLIEPVNATRSAGWFWKTHGLNEIADNSDFVKITRRVNGGINGLNQRLSFYTRALKILGAA